MTNSAVWIPVIVGSLVIIAFCAGPPFLVAFLTWKLVLRSRPLRLGDSALMFAASAVSAVTLYGHAGPVPVVVLLLSLEEGRSTSAIWMLTTGLLVTCFFFWWSRRGRRQENG